MKKKKTKLGEIPRHPETKCPKCDHQLDITACAGCGTLLVFRKDMSLRPPTEGELAEFLFGMPLQQMRQVVEAVQ